MKKVMLGIICSIAFGCQPGGTYTSHSEYNEERTFDKEKGFVTTPTAKWSMEWED